MINVNPQSDFPAASPAFAQCNCSIVNMVGFPFNGAPDAVMQDSGITYTRTVCVNFVTQSGSGFTPNCPDNPPPITPLTDHGLKNIRVQVSWNAGNQPHTLAAEGMVTR